jgi:protein SCO1
MALLKAAGLLATGFVPTASGAQTPGHAGMGPVEPRAELPDVPLTLHSGRPARLSELLRGKVTALQLMFTGCSSTCPIQGAIFASLQARLAQAPVASAQLLSVSIDPLADDAKALAAWRQRFKADALWLAAAPGIQYNDRLPDFLGSRPRPGSTADRHLAQVYLIDKRGRLAYRLAELASASAIAKALSELARLG